MHGYRKLTMICAAAVLTLGLAACGGGSSPTTDNGDQTQGPTPAEQIAALQKQINALRADLGLDPIDIDDLTGSVADLTQRVADLQKQIDDAADDKAAADAKAHMAKLQKLATAIGAVNSGDLDAHVRASDLPGFMRPKGYFFCDEIPRNPGNGNMLRRLLRDAAAQAQNTGAPDWRTP